MRGSNKTTTTVAVRSQIWDIDTTPGPQILYRHFVDKALSDHLPQLEALDEPTRNLVDQAVDLTLQVVCTAANIAPSWDGLYAFINAQIFPPLAERLSKPEGQR